MCQICNVRCAMLVQHGLHDLREPPTSSVPALARLFSACNAPILLNSLLQDYDRSETRDFVTLRKPPTLLCPPDRHALCFFLRISHKLFHYTVRLSHFTCSGFLPGVVGIAFGLNRAAVTNNSEVMRDHRAIPFPWTLLLPALRQRVTECTT